MLKPAEALGSLGVSASENPILCLNLSNLNQRESVGVRLHRHTGGSNAAPARGVPKAVFKWDEIGTRDGMQLRASSLLNLEGKPSKMGQNGLKLAEGLACHKVGFRISSGISPKGSCVSPAAAPVKLGCAAVNMLCCHKEFTLCSL